MPQVINGTTYYQAKEVADLLGVSKQTLLRWIREEKVVDAKYRNRNGWRFFDEKEIESLKTYAFQGLGNNNA